MLEAIIIWLILWLPAIYLINWLKMKPKRETLYEEIINFLKLYWKIENDVEYVLWYTKFPSYDDWIEVYNTWDWFKSNSDFLYDSWFGTNHIQLEMKIVWKDFWLERHEYDWSESWEYKEFPVKPKTKWIIEIQDKDL